jgi:hypothetical protein
MRPRGNRRMEAIGRLVADFKCDQTCPQTERRPFAGSALSQVRCRRLCRGRQGMQTEDPRHGRRFWAPRAARSQHQGGDRREGMTIDLPQINCPVVPQPGQNTSNHGVSAISAARIVGDHRMSRLATSCSFQRSMTAFASARAAASATCRLAFLAMSRPRVRTPMRQYRPTRAWLPPPLPMSHHCRAVGVLDLDPVPRRARPVGRRKPLRNDAFAAHHVGLRSHTFMDVARTFGRAGRHGPGLDEPSRGIAVQMARLRTRCGSLPRPHRRSAPR